MCVCVCADIYIYIHVNMYAYKHIQIYIYICTCIHKTCIHVQICVYACVCVCDWVCITAKKIATSNQIRLAAKVPELEQLIRVKDAEVMYIHITTHKYTYTYMLVYIHTLLHIYLYKKIKNIKKYINKSIARLKTWRMRWMIGGWGSHGLIYVFIHI